MKLFINIIIGIILIVLGTALWLNKAYLFSLNQDATELTTETKVDIHHEEKAALGTESLEEKISDEPEVAKENTNAAADGLSRYYANLHGEMDGKGPKIRNNIYNNIYK